MQKHIRNFSIIAHIDHGKSTLADRLISECKGVSERQLSAQVMDTMDIEQERGITIKAQSVRLQYVKDGEVYILNLIDTPGHVDFSYEVSRSLCASNGALLIVDSSQGVEAQTIANVYIAIENNLEILPVLNKIDLPNADVDRVKDDIEQTIGVDCTNANEVSAKTGAGIVELLDDIVTKIPPPNGDENAPTKALVYDSWFDSYLGVLALVRVFDGSIKKNQIIKLMQCDSKQQVLGLMYPNPIKNTPTNEIKTGEVGIVSMGVKDVDSIKVGDTITDFANPCDEPIAGFSEAKSFVFAGFYPIDTDKFEDLRDALNKLRLNDSSISFEPESSVALGLGFRAGFLGMLHLEITKERLEREFHIDLIATTPTVIYEVKTKKGEIISVANPSELPPQNLIEYIKEPYVRANILTPDEYVGALIKLLNNKRGEQIKMDYINEDRVMLEYNIPMNEIVVDFYDTLKSITRGYASFEYEVIGFREGNLKKLDILVAGDVVDALSVIVDESKALAVGRVLVKQLKDIIPRQLFVVSIQAALGGKILARENVKSVGKNVTAKCYGGDITRKRKLLEKQKAGKKRMKAIGKVNIPTEAFMSVLKLKDG